jgi:DNA primase
VSRSNAAWSLGRGRGIVDVRVLRVPCPVCGSRDRCGVRAEPPSLVICYRVPSSEHSADGGFVHREGRFEGMREALAALPPSVQRAPVAALDAAYRAVLARCGLSIDHREALRRRGLTATHIELAGYATLDARGRAALGRAVVDAVGADLAARVPGYVTRSQDGRSWPSLGGWPGLLVPCRDTNGRILGMQVRRDQPDGGPRYVWLSSRSQGGASSAAFAHVPVVRADADRSTVIVTEGPLKADVVTVLDGRLCVSIPGVSSWRSVLEVLDALRPSRVLVAFDTDVMTNPTVSAAHDALCSALVANSITCASLRWPSEFGKGLDDALLSQLRRRKSAA